MKPKLLALFFIAALLPAQEITELKFKKVYDHNGKETRQSFFAKGGKFVDAAGAQTKLEEFGALIAMPLPIDAGCRCLTDKFSGKDSREDATSTDDVYEETRYMSALFRSGELFHIFLPDGTGAQRGFGNLLMVRDGKQSVPRRNVVQLVSVLPSGQEALTFDELARAVDSLERRIESAKGYIDANSKYDADMIEFQKKKGELEKSTDEKAKEDLKKLKPPKKPGADSRNEAFSKILASGKQQVPVLVLCYGDTQAKRVSEIAKKFNLKTAICAFSSTSYQENCTHLIPFPSFSNPAGFLDIDYQSIVKILNRENSNAMLGKFCDSGYGGGRLQISLYDYACLLWSKGAERTALIRAISGNPSKFFGLEDEIGVLENGRYANLLLLDGEPFAPATKVAGVVVNGKVWQF